MKKIRNTIALCAVISLFLFITGCASDCLRWETRYRTENKQECTTWERTPYNRCLMYRYYTVQAPYSHCVEFKKEKEKTDAGK